MVVEVVVVQDKKNIGGLMQNLPLRADLHDFSHIFAIIPFCGIILVFWY